MQKVSIPAVFSVVANQKTSAGNSAEQPISTVKTNEPKDTFISSKEATGIAAGTFLGGLIGAVGGKITNNKSSISNDAIKKQGEVIELEFRTRVLNGLNKLIKNERLSKEEAKLLHDLELDTPAMRYFYQNPREDFNLAQEMIDFYSKPFYYPKRCDNQNALMKLTVYNKFELYDATVEYLKGNKDKESIIDIFSEEYKMFTDTDLKAIINETIENHGGLAEFKQKGAVECPELVYKGISDKLSSIPYSWHDEYYENFIKTKLANKANKNMIKFVGIGTVAAGAIATLATLAIKNNSNKDKK